MNSNGQGFAPATRYQAKARIALAGPAKSGKTFTSLRVAAYLGGRIALIDTERGSASKYVGEPEIPAFDVLELSAFSPDDYITAIELAAKLQYPVLIIDSVSHAWMGSGGVLEIVDIATSRSRAQNAYTSGWREATPMHNKLVEAMLHYPGHLIVTVRTKSRYVMEADRSGKQVPKKVGMEWVQRDGLEYEFDVVGELDNEHTLVVRETRCRALDGKVFAKPGEEFAEPIMAWLSIGQAMDRFHTRDAEVKAGLPPGTYIDEFGNYRDKAIAEEKERHELQRAAAEEEQSSGQPPQETSDPFVPVEKMGGGTPSTAIASPSTLPQEDGAGTTARKPSLLTGEELKQALNNEFKRLADQYSTEAICKKGWGEAIDSMDKVRQLKEASLRSGLKKLQAIQLEQPPSAEEQPPEGPSMASSAPMEDAGASEEEDVPSFPPSDGNTPNLREGVQEPQGATIVNHGHNGATQEEKVDSNEHQAQKNVCVVVEAGTGIACIKESGHQPPHYFTPSRPEEHLVVLPDKPLVVDEINHYISTSDTRMLERWCQQHGQADLFLLMTRDYPRNTNGNILVTEDQWHLIQRIVQLNATPAAAANA